MSIQSMRKDILELKRAVAFENKQSEKSRYEKMTDEELQEDINHNLEMLGFKSTEELHEAAKKYFTDNDLNTVFSSDYMFEKSIFEHLEDIVLKYGIVGEFES